MAARRQLDSRCRALAGKVILASVLLVCYALASAGQHEDAERARLESARQALDREDWDDAAKLASGPSTQSVELDLIQGLALARLSRWSDARAALEAGRRKAPGDGRFPAELAGVAYKQKRFALAKHELRAAIRLNPGDSYNYEFLATIYLLEGNIEAALKYWNAFVKPRLNAVAIEPQPRLDERTLNGAVAFNPPQVLSTDALLATNSRLDLLGVFSRPRVDLSPTPSGTYDASIHTIEKNGFGDSWLGALLSTFAGAAYTTAYPEYFNFGREAINFDSLARWDAQKRRFAATIAAPLAHDPTKKAELFVDERNENWNLSQTFTGVAAPLSDVNVRSITGGARLKFAPNGHWSWSTGVEIASHSFRNGAVPPAISASRFFTDTNSLAVWLGGGRSLLRLPERRFTVDVSGEARVGRDFADSLGGFGTLRGSLLAHWLPRATGDDYEMRTSLRVGGLAGHATLDELFQLGIERDNDLWLRGHTGLNAGRKGGAPLGRRYFLANWEIDKNVYNAGFVKIKLGPLLDAGAIADASGFFGSREWLVDAGAQCKVQILGSVTVVVSYGHDLRGGHNVVFPTVLR